jgi:hypothetical protein
VRINTQKKTEKLIVLITAQKNVLSAQKLPHGTVIHNLIVLQRKQIGVKQNMRKMVKAILPTIVQNVVRNARKLLHGTVIQNLTAVM